MARIYLTEEDLGEHAEFILESVTDGSDPLSILLAAEEDPDEVFFAELERLITERKARQRALGTPNKPTRKGAKRATFH